MTASDFIAAGTAAIALCALVFTYWQTKHSVQHSALSIRPILSWHKKKEAVAAGCALTFTLKNLGLGPAVIRKRYFSVGGGRFDSEPDGNDLVETVALKAIGDRFEFRVLQSGTPGVGSAMPSGSEFLIAQLLLIGMSTNASEIALRSLEEIDFVVEYESMQKERFTLSALNGNSPGWGASR